MHLKIKINNLLCALVSLVGLIVVLSWAFDVSWPKNIILGAETMKALTAFNFILAGLVPIFLNSRWKDFIVPMLSVFLIFSSFSAIVQGSAINFLDYREESSSPSLSSSLPSMITLISFMMVGTAGIFSLVNGGKTASIVGNFLFGVGSMCVLGYIIRNPALYYYIENFSSAMAIHTGVLFSILGWSLSHQSLYRDLEKRRNPKKKYVGGASARPKILSR